MPFVEVDGARIPTVGMGPMTLKGNACVERRIRSSIRARSSPPAASTAFRSPPNCPLARGKVPGNATLAQIGAARGRSPAQVALRYLVQLGLVVIPRSGNPQRLAENLAIFDFTLSDAERADIAKLKRPDGRVVNPPHAPKWDI